MKHAIDSPFPGATISETFLRRRVPDYRYPERLTGTSKFQRCGEVFDEYLAHCHARLRRDDLAAASVNSYRRILDGICAAVGCRLDELDVQVITTPSLRLDLPADR